MISDRGNSNKLLNGKVPLQFLFVSKEGSSGDLAWTLFKEGHKVKIFIKGKLDPDMLEGFVEKIEQWEKWTAWADIILFDDVGFGYSAEKLRKTGKLVIGGSLYTDRLEVDRGFGQAELKKHGVNILPSWDFVSYDKAIAFIKRNPARYIFKPSGDFPSAGKFFVFLSKDDQSKDLIEMLSYNKKVFRTRIKKFQLQKVVVGVEVAVGAFFNGKDFIFPINVNFEHKRVFSGDLGFFADEVGTLMFWDNNNVLFRETLVKMLPAFQASGYIGYLDLNCIVNGSGIYPLEWTCRFGYPTISVQLESMAAQVGQFLNRLAGGESFELKVKRGFQIGVALMVPPYLTSEEDLETAEIFHDLPILFKNPKSIKGVHIYCVKMIDGIWYIAGQLGYLLVVTGSGKTVREARKQAYARIQNIMIQNMFYRTDVGAKWTEDSDKLRTWGYLD